MCVIVCVSVSIFITATYVSIDIMSTIILPPPHASFRDDAIRSYPGSTPSHMSNGSRLEETIFQKAKSKVRT